MSDEFIELRDGKEIELRPLVISRQKKFSKVWAAHAAKTAKAIFAAQASEDNEVILSIEEELNDEQFEVTTELLKIALDEHREDLCPGVKDKEWVEYIENNVDQPMAHKIFKVCGNLDLSGNDADPNLKAASPGGN